MLELLKSGMNQLSKEYYQRQILFGCLCGLLYFLLSTGGPGQIIKALILVPINTYLYPYSRYVYESVVEYVIGDNRFFFEAGIFVIVKFITIFFCWYFAIFIAPIGLLYLAKRKEKLANMEGKEKTQIVEE